VLSTAGRYDEALEQLESAAQYFRSTANREAEGRVTARIGHAHRQRGTPAEGILRVQAMLDTLDAGEPSANLVSLYATLERLLFSGGRYGEQLVAAERAEQLAREVGDPGLVAEAEVSRGSALVMVNRIEEGVRVLEAAIPMVEAAGNLDVLQRAENNLGAGYTPMGLLSEAVRHRSRALELAERIGDPALQSFAAATTGRAFIEMGDWKQARSYIERAADLVPTETAIWYYSAPGLHLGWLALWEGDWEEARRGLQQSVAIGEHSQDLQVLRQAHGLLAELDILEGHPEAAIARLEPLAGDQKSWTLLHVFLPLAWSYLEQGDDLRAEHFLEEASYLTADLPLFNVEALRITGMLLSRRRQWEEAARVLKESIELARAIPYPYREAQSLFEYGVMLLGKCSPEEARSWLENALSVFQRLGAKKDVERTEQALRQT